MSDALSRDLADGAANGRLWFEPVPAPGLLIAGVIVTRLDGDQAKVECVRCARRFDVQTIAITKASPDTRFEHWCKPGKRRRRHGTYKINVGDKLGNLTVTHEVGGGSYRVLCKCGRVLIAKGTELRAPHLRRRRCASDCRYGMPPNGVRVPRADGTVALRPSRSAAAITEGRSPAVLSEREILAERLAASLEGLGLDELRVLERVAAGLVTGREAYGEMKIASDSRDFVDEATQELRDALVYFGAGLVRLQRRRGRGTS